MKKLITIFLVLLYTSTTLGTVVNFHYCKGYLAHISFLNYGGKTGCACKQKDMRKGCCNDQLHYEKADNHKAVQPVSLLNVTPIATEPPAAGNYYIPVVQVGYKAPFRNDDASRSCPEPIYLLNRVFLI